VKPVAKAGNVFPVFGAPEIQRTGQIARGVDAVVQFDRLFPRAAMHIVQHVDRAAIALLSDAPQVTAMRAVAIDGACGPWSTAATSAASSSRACGRRRHRSPRSISQIIWGKLTPDQVLDRAARGSRCARVPCR
jgi:hypothetical protein